MTVCVCREPGQRMPRALVLAAKHGYQLDLIRRGDKSETMYLLRFQCPSGLVCETNLSSTRYGPVTTRSMLLCCEGLFEAEVE